MIRVEHLADVLIEITDTLVDAVDPIEFLQLITARCASMSRSLWAGVVLADPQGRLQLAAASTESAAFRELFELENAQGPWLDCFRTGSPVVNTDLTQAEDRWPVLVPRAVSAGFRSVSAFPLRGVKDVIGALNLFSSDPDHLEPRDVRSLQVLADVATIGLLDENSSHDWVLAAARLQHSLTVGSPVGRPRVSWPRREASASRPPRISSTATPIAPTSTLTGSLQPSSPTPPTQT